MLFDDTTTISEIASPTSDGPDTGSTGDHRPTVSTPKVTAYKVNGSKGPINDGLFYHSQGHWRLS